MNNPLISIVIPVYNGSNYMREAIDSALAQTYDNFEVIVINDGSTDNGLTNEIALSYGKRIRYFSKPNGGVATALNLGIREMKGEYFSWLSHDDMYYPQKLERQIEYLKQCGDKTRIVINDYDILDSDSNKKTAMHMIDSYSTEQIENSVFTVLQGLLGGCAMLIHKSHFDRVGVFNEKLITTQDYDLWFRMLRGQKVLYVPECLTITRVHSLQGSKTLTCHDPERQALHINFIEALSDEEICSMYKSKSIFFYRMCTFFKGGHMPDAYKYANKLLNNEPIPEDIHDKLAAFHQYLSTLSNGCATKLCIFCAGEWGLRLYHELKSKLVYVDFFSDNNPDKYGYITENTYCIPVNKLTDVKNETLVIVATRTPDSIVSQLKALGFPYVATKQQIDKIMFDVPPVKWITSMDSLDDVDYTSKEVMALITRFKETIFDICKYYENKKAVK